MTDFENKSSDEFYIILIPPRRRKCTLPFVMLKKGTFDLKKMIARLLRSSKQRTVREYLIRGTTYWCLK